MKKQNKRGIDVLGSLTSSFDKTRASPIYKFNLKMTIVVIIATVGLCSEILSSILYVGRDIVQMHITQQPCNTVVKSGNPTVAMICITLEAIICLAFCIIMEQVKNKKNNKSSGT